MDLLAEIANIPLFAGLSKTDLSALSTITVVKQFPKGKLIFSQGEEALGFYAIVSGRVKVHKLSPEGKEQILHVFGPGEPFAEAAVFARRKYPAYAEAMEGTTALFFPRDPFVSLISRHPAISLNMLGELSLRLHKFATMIEDLSLKEVPGRLAAHLLYLSERQGETDDLVLELTKVQLASLLGTIPETLSRILARMAREGLIELGEARQIRLLDRKSLQDLASGEMRLG